MTRAVPLPPLPIDDALPALIGAVREHGVAVLVAPPGAGKTTRVPGALLDAGVAGDGDVVCLQPRRLAARLAATRVASERGGRLGGEVGFEVRFDRAVGADTRIRFVTEGIVTRRLLADPTLRGTSCLIIDELHERHLDGDLALALAARLRAGPRPDLRIVAMSATLEADAVAAFLGAPIVRSEGRAYPVEIEYAPDPHDRPLGKQVAAAVRRLLIDKLDGDILVFLPGVGEIRRASDDLAEVAATFDVSVVPLHGDLTADEQDRAVARAPRRKVILATNVAETSVTIDGVVAVIDSGLARVARHSPWSGLPTLQIEPISRASATQRAGRAGRTRPGRCVRLYDAHDHDGRRGFDLPEIARADLAQVALEVRAAGVGALADLRWLDPPPAPAVAAAEEMLRRLGAVGADGALAPLGRRMLRFPAHPRLARLLCEAEDRGVADEGALAAAALGARELRLERRSHGGPGGGARHSSPSDVLDDVDALLDARASGLKDHALRRAGLDVSTARSVDRAARQLERLCAPRRRGDGARTDAELDAALQLAILTGFPDRVGKRRAARSAEVLFAGGGSGTLAPTSAVIDAELMVAVDVAETGVRGAGVAADRGAASRVSIRRASAIDPSWLLDLYLDRIDDRDELVWNATRERVERVRRMVYDGLVIDETVEAGVGERAEDAATVLARQAISAGLARFVDADALAAWRARVGFAAQHAGDPALIAPTDEHLAEVLGRACAGLTSFAELRRADLLGLLDGSLGPRRALLERLAPTHLALPGRRRVAIHYELDRPPWIGSRMQDFFGLARAPTVADGRVALVLHLLAPNQRPVQVTQDLPGFWVKHYPAIRKELMRKYPRHQWPEDPARFIAED